jgi:hypothetical protein
LQQLGFVDVELVPSPLLRSSSTLPTALGDVLFQFAQLANTVSGGRLVTTPSMLVCAKYAGR